jgi:hypothetical protein
MSRLRLSVELEVDEDAVRARNNSEDPWADLMTRIESIVEVELCTTNEPEWNWEWER